MDITDKAPATGEVTAKAGWRQALEVMRLFDSGQVQPGLHKLAAIGQSHGAAAIACCLARCGCRQEARQMLERAGDDAPFPMKALRDWLAGDGPADLPGFVSAEMARCQVATSEQLSKLGWWSDARHLLTMALDTAPGAVQPRWFNLLARCDLELGDPAAARSWLETSAAMAAGSGKASDHLALARGWHILADWEAALAAAQRGLALEPGNGSALAECGRALMRQGKARQALRITRRLFAARAGLPPFEYLLLSRIALAAGDLDAAGTVVKLAARFGAADTEIAGSQFGLHLASGDARAALEMLEADPHLARSRPPRELALSLCEAVDSRPEALRLLRLWAPDEADMLVGQAFDLRSATEGPPDQGFDPEEVIARRGLPERQQWNARCRALLRTYLARREYRQFDAFARLAIHFAPRRQIEKLHRHALDRYPRSRLCLQLGYYLSGQTVPAQDPDVAFATRWRLALSPPDHPVCRAARDFGQVDLLCTAMVRDENAILPDFLEHYAALGVRNFLIIDNRSREDPGQVTRSFPQLNIRIVRVDESYVTTRHGMAWINAVLGATLAEWHLFVDVDEFLVYPGSSRRGIAELIGQMDAEGADCFGAEMLDVYDRAYAQGQVPSADRKRHNLFLATRRVANHLGSPGRYINGGVRRYPLQSKVPLLRVRAGIRYLNHVTTPARMASVAGALMHYKVWRDRDLIGLAPSEIARHRRVADRALGCVRRHQQFGALNPLAPADHAFHLEATEHNLHRLGYIRSGSSWQARTGLRLPPDRSVAGRLACDTIARQGGMPGIADQPSLAQAMAALRLPLVREDAATRRRLVTATLARIGPRWIALGFLAVAALANGREAAATRLLARFRASVGQASPGAERICLDPILAEIAHHRPQIGRELHEQLIASGLGNPPGYIQLLLQLAEWQKLDAALAAFDDGSARFAMPALRMRQVMRDWPAFQDRLDQFLKSGPEPTPALLSRINCLTDLSARAEFQNRLAAQVAGDDFSQSANSLQTLLAIAVVQQRTDDFLALHDEHGARLTGGAADYFSRLAAHLRHGTVWPTVWGIGLSKTGTTSLHHFAGLAGRLSAHWINPYLGRMVDETDMQIFDIVSDISVPYFARRSGVRPGRRLISTERDFASWQRSLFKHYALVRGPADPSFDSLRAMAADGVPFMFDPLNTEVHHEVYFRFSTLREAFDYQCRWVDRLAAAPGSPVLRLPLDSPCKAGLVADFLGLGGRIPAYPRSNVTLVEDLSSE